MIFLQSNDVSTAYAAKIYKTYGNESISVVRENPFRLADDIWGIGFKTADRIAAKLGYEPQGYERCRSGIRFTLNELASEGNVYALKDQLVKKGMELLDIPEAVLSSAVDTMTESGELIRDREAIYLPPFYYAECGVASRLLELSRFPEGKEKEISFDEEAISRVTGIRFDSIQLSAIRVAASSKLMILTGGPGTGKTTSTRGIIAMLRSAGMRVLLAAPTGRAAKRMTESTGLEAKTIHRLLEFKPPEGYQRNENSPLEGDVLIVDECSMVDLLLMNALLKAIPPAMRLVLIGDVDQLPSVGCGNVLRDIIESGSFPVVKLTRIFRQAQNSRIITNAHRINKGSFPEISNNRNSDFFFLEEEDAEKAAKTIVDLVKRRLPKSYGINPNQIQVLTPMQRGAVGAANLNILLQDAINRHDISLRRSGCDYRLLDKVMQIRNNYEKEVFNGDIGIITAVNAEERELSVTFDGRTVIYDQTELDELVLAYACTIHKSQGSEYPVVVMPVMMTHFVMLQRNLLYTGITRAKKLLVIIGSKKALSYAVRNQTVSSRNSFLKERLHRMEAAG